MTNIKSEPNWANSSGKDEYSYWVSLEIEVVEQRFRWIEAGEFMMGSAKDESERYDNENEHKVKLTKGYWLANKVSTQDYGN